MVKDIEQLNTRGRKMNVLEKILEEIKERIEKLNMADNMCRENAERNRNFESVKYFQSLMFATERAKSIIEDIIRSHMDEVNDTNVPSNWIPCSERLPNEIEFQEAYCRNQYAAEILVTIKGATRPTTLYFKNNSWFDEERNYYEVVAWQPLPEPYKGGKENE